jgi:hypothetical protein
VVHQATGNVYVADNTGYNIRVITPSGVCTTLAGAGPAVAAATGAIDDVGTIARFNSPRGLAFDALGNLYVADSSNNKIRKVSQCGQVSSVTGVPNTLMAATANAGNGGPLSGALFNTPYGVAVSPTTGVLYVIEYSGSAIRAITLPGYSSAQPVCDGNWHSVATTFSGGANPQTVRTFVDGQLMTSTLSNVDLTGSNLTSLYIGQSGEPSHSYYLGGAISDVRVFSRALSCAEPAALALPVLRSFAGAAPTPAVITPLTTVVTYSCNIGWAGATVIFSKNVSGDLSWSFSPALPSCTLCPAGTYADGAVCVTLNAQCGALPSYAMGGSSFGCCPAPSTVLAASGLGCAPNPADPAKLPGAPTDTAVAYTGSFTEGLGGLIPSSTGIFFGADRYGTVKGALNLAGGYASASAAGLPAALPAPGAAASVTAAVRCSLDPMSTSNMTVVEWARPAAGDTGVRLGLVVTGSNNVGGVVGTASTPITAAAALHLLHKSH